MGSQGGSCLAAHRETILNAVAEYLSNCDGVANGSISPTDALGAPDILIYTDQCQTFHILPWLAGMEGQPYLRMLEMHWANEAVQIHATVRAKQEKLRQEMLARQQSSPPYAMPVN